MIDKTGDGRTRGAIRLLWIGSLPIVFTILMVVRSELDPDAERGGLGMIFLLAYLFMIVTHAACIGSLAWALARNELQAPARAWRVIGIAIVCLLVPVALFLAPFFIHR